MTARKRRATAAAAPEPAPVQAVSRPILCSPYDEPGEHWKYARGEAAPERVPGRRPASYYYMTKRTGAAQLQMFAEPERDELELVNLLRADVKRWREADYPGAEQVTKQLLRHWANAELPRRLFYCQREAVETIIYLREILDAGRTTRWKQKLTPDDYARLKVNEKPGFVEQQASWYPRLIDAPASGNGPLLRYGCKMATGSGKTVVMAMLIAWTFCNRGRRPADRRFADAVLVVCPNLTVKERLQVLRPEHPLNYYEAFDLLPSTLMTELRKGLVLVENWHRFMPESPHAESGRTYTVVNKGAEGPEAFGRRVIGELYDRGPVMVLNDEAHHAYRPAPVREDERISAEAKADREGGDRLGRWSGSPQRRRRRLVLRGSLRDSLLPRRQRSHRGRAVPLARQRFRAGRCHRVRHSEDPAPACRGSEWPAGAKVLRALAHHRRWPEGGREAAGRQAEAGGGLA